jgi:hypothetical protein
MRKLLGLACAGIIVVGGGSVALATGHGWNRHHHGQPPRTPVASRPGLAANQPAPKLTRLTPRPTPRTPAPTSAPTSLPATAAPTSAAPAPAPTSAPTAKRTTAPTHHPVLPVSGVSTANVGALKVDLDGSGLLRDWYSSASHLDVCPGGTSYSPPRLDSSGDLDLTTSGRTGSCAYVQSNGQYGYGTYEARIYAPAGPNHTIANWPAFYGNGENWPNGGEIDAFEAMGGTDAAGYDPGLPAGQLTGPGITSAPGWHTIDAIWGPGTLAIYTDGHLSDRWSSPYLVIRSGGTSAMWWTIDNFTGDYGYNTGRPSTLRVQYVRYWAWHKR